HSAAQRRRGARDVRAFVLDARRVAGGKPVRGVARRRSDAARPGLRIGRGAALGEEAPACFCRLNSFCQPIPARYDGESTKFGAYWGQKNGKARSFLASMS